MMAGMINKVVVAKLDASQVPENRSQKSEISPRHSGGDAKAGGKHVH